MSAEIIIVLLVAFIFIFLIVFLSLGFTGVWDPFGLSGEEEEENKLLSTLKPTPTPTPTPTTPTPTTPTPTTPIPTTPTPTTPKPATSNINYDDYMCVKPYEKSSGNQRDKFHEIIIVNGKLYCIMNDEDEYKRCIQHDDLSTCQSSLNNYSINNYSINNQNIKVKSVNEVFYLNESSTSQNTNTQSGSTSQNTNTQSGSTSQNTNTQSGSTSGSNQLVGWGSSWNSSQFLLM
jgi:hypothetical protein